jgi:hypothetical protein
MKFHVTCEKRDLNCHCMTKWVTTMSANPSFTPGRGARHFTGGPSMASVRNTFSPPWWNSSGVPCLLFVCLEYLPLRDARVFAPCCKLPKWGLESGANAVCMKGVETESRGALRKPIIKIWDGSLEHKHALPSRHSKKPKVDPYFRERETVHYYFSGRDVGIRL